MDSAMAWRLVNISPEAVIKTPVATEAGAFPPETTSATTAGRTRACRSRGEIGGKGGAGARGLGASATIGADRGMIPATGTAAAGGVGATGAEIARFGTTTGVGRAGRMAPSRPASADPPEAATVNANPKTVSEPTRMGPK
jgi:hypothetical protein